MKASIETEVNAGEWDVLVAASGDGNIFQTAAWADYLRDRFKVKSFFVRVDKEHVSGPVCILRCSVESPANRFLLERPFIGLTAPLAGSLFSNLTWEAGPVFFHTELKKEALSVLLEAVDSLCRRERVVKLSGAWPGIYGPEAVEENNKCDKTWLEHGFRAEMRSTLIVDLSVDKDILWSSLKSSARKCVRRAVEAGITVKRLQDESELAEYSRFIQSSRKAMGLDSPSIKGLGQMWRALKPAGMLEIFCALKDSRLVGGIGIWRHAGVLHEWGAVQAPEARERKLYSSDILKWEIIRWGHESGARYYDLAGVAGDSDKASPKEQGIYQFKAKWGGREIAYPAYSKCFKLLRSRIFSTGAGLWRKIQGN